MKGIIYKWTCSKSGKSYIGQTTDEKRRENEFLSENNIYTSENSIIDKARKKYGLSKDIWKKEVLKRLWCKEGNEDELLKRLNYWEKYYISEYNTFNNGYNSTDGGKQLNVSIETRKLLKYKTTIYHEKNSRHVTKEVSKKISEKMKNFHKNKTKNINNLAHHIYKIPVYKIDKKTNVILAKYDSIDEAGIKNNISSTSIRIVCRGGNRKTAGGFKWKFCNDNNTIKKVKGCSFNKKLQRWRSRVKYNKKSYLLGMFIKEESAKKIYVIAKEQISNNNFIEWYNNIYDEKIKVMKECGEI